MPLKGCHFLDTPIRKRGVKASRSKLETAMLTAGFNTQLDIAKQIAREENLANIPKDLVNRVFRQENVSPHTIARVAKALNVMLYTLYLSMDEDEQLQTMAVPAHEENTSKTLNKNRLLLFIMIVVTLSFLAFQATYHESIETNEVDNPAIQKPLLGQYSIAIISAFEQLNNFSSELEHSLSANFSTIVVDRTLHRNLLMSVDIARQFESDAVLTLRLIREDEYLGVQAYLYFQQLEKLIWAGSLTVDEITNQKEFMVEQLSLYVSVAMGIKPTSSNLLPNFESIAAQEKYLKAKKILSTDLTELSYITAKEYLRAAIDLSPDFARAYASLCENTVINSWRGDEKANLEEAQIACDKAIKLAPNDFYVISAMAYLLRRTGRVSESITQYQNILAQWPSSAKAMSGISSAYLDAYRQNLTAFPNAIQQAINYGEQATIIQPKNWMNHMQLGMMYYFSGDIKQAIKSYQQSAALHPTAGAYASIGTMYLCRGKIEQSITAFTHSHQLDPTSYIGDEFLGTGHYYLGNYKKSATLRKKALNTIEVSGGSAIHQMWGQLANSYRRSGEMDKAIDAYHKAITLVDKDIMRSNDADEDHIYRYYYHLYLSKLAPKTYPESALKNKKIVRTVVRKKNVIRSFFKTSYYLVDRKKG